jgi:excisionase family DNA binding protein
MEVNAAYSTQEVATRYKVHPNTVRQMQKDGRLKGGRVGRDFRFSPSECDRVFLGVEPRKDRRQHEEAA